MDVPASFERLLRDTDPNLVAYFNPFKRRFVIDRNVEGQQATNVMIVQSEDGEFMPLTDNTIDRVRSMDAWSKFGSYEAFHRHNIQMAAEDEAKRKAEIKENYRLAGLDDKIQLNRAHTLTQRHDTHRINQ